MVDNESNKINKQKVKEAESEAVLKQLNGDNAHEHGESEIADEVFRSKQHE